MLQEEQQKSVGLTPGNGFRQGEGEWLPQNDVAGGKSATSTSTESPETHGGMLLEMREADHNGC